MSTTSDSPSSPLGKVSSHASETSGFETAQESDQSSEHTVTTPLQPVATIKDDEEDLVGAATGMAPLNIERTTSSSREKYDSFPSDLMRRPTLRPTRSNYDPNDPINLERVQTARSIQEEVFGAKRRREKPRSDLPAFGGGKDYPPDALDQEIYLVDFDGADDPLHPQNWSLKRKLKIMAILGFATFVVAWGSSSFAPSTVFIREVFHVGSVVSYLSISLYVFGFASGPLLWAPLSELYGRRLVILVSIFICAIFHMGVATSRDIQTVMLCRFFAGFFGASLLAVVPAAFADVFGNKSRGVAIALFSAAVFTGPIIAPPVNGFIVESYLGWRWTAYLTSIMGFASVVPVVFYMEETYAPSVLVAKAQYLRQETGNWCIRARQEESDFNFKELVEHNLSRPLRMLFQEPILFLITVYIAFIYGILYLLLEAYPIIFYEGYHMPFAVAQLPYLSVVVGQLFGGVIVLSFEPMTYRRTMANGGRPIPEVRLLPTMIGAVLFTIGLFWLTWTGAYPQNVHWLAPTFAGLFIGAGLITIFLSAINYIVESYLMFAASALAANTFLRSAFGGSFPLFASIMFHNLGTQWAGTLLGCIAFILIPVPVLFYVFGKRLRKASKYAPT
ncbi:major facilitator superfamily domain-containing protein [Lipomyces arxii]|uniref:major facilitator superfamily domain-containing protein n=1 Tax=Lipomyces arxii TaxID=56418 RepID=UPI0034D0200F